MRKAKRARVASGSTRVVYAALIGNILVTVTKFAAAALSGSSAMFSEALHSLVDTSNEIVILYGLHRAKSRPDRDHPLGYGRELYFWSFIVAILIFTLGAGVALYEGIAQIRDPHVVSHPEITYVVLAISFVFEFSSWQVAFRAFRAAKGTKGYWEAFKRSKDPPGFMVLLEDSAALIGILIAFVGVFAAARLQLPVLDGVASVAISLLLTAMAALLAQESKSLLIGEPAEPEVVDSILEIARSVPQIKDANGLLSVQLAPDQIVIALGLELRDDLRTSEIEAAIEELERRVCEAQPQVTALFVKPQAARRPG